MPTTGADGQMPSDAGAGGAEILRFPGRFRPGAEARTRQADEATARLDRALLALTQALAEQQEAVRAWRQSLDTLAGSVRALAGSVRALDAELDAAASRLQPSIEGKADGTNANGSTLLPMAGQGSISGAGRQASIT